MVCILLCTRPISEISLNNWKFLPANAEVYQRKTNPKIRHQRKEDANVNKLSSLNGVSCSSNYLKAQEKSLALILPATEDVS